MMRGKVVVVTGATRGIGRYAALTFAKEGANVALVGRDDARLRSVSDELKRAGAECLALRADVRSDGEARAMIEQVMRRFDGIDVLVNNAAVVTHFSMGSPRWPRIRNMDKIFWDLVIETNLGGTFLCTKHALPHMEARGSGHIVNLYGSSSVKKGGGCVYAVSKEAIRTFTRYLAEEERQWNIRVVAMTPGAALATEDAGEEARRRLPGVESIGNAFVALAGISMESTGRTFALKNGSLQVVT